MGAKMHLYLLKLLKIAYFAKSLNVANYILKTATAQSLSSSEQSKITLDAIWNSGEDSGYLCV